MLLTSPKGVTCPFTGRSGRIPSLAESDILSVLFNLMEAITLLQRQRAEMELVLQSGLFAKAPRLEKFFRYVCERHFEENGDQIKEYSIALEALGRPSDFDPKRDSIVRVEAHRLRKRLEAYYSGPGAFHPVHISMPAGQYRPQFQIQQSGEEETTSKKAIPAETKNLPEFATLAPVLIPDRRSSNRRWGSLVLLLLGLVGVLAAALLVHAKHIRSAAFQQSSEVWNGPAIDVLNRTDFRMLAGYHGPPVLDRQGRKWMADAFYKGGISTAIPREHLTNVEPDADFIKTQRSGQFEYAIPLRQTNYEVHLYFVETEYGPGNPRGGGAAARAFQISINGALIFKLLDPLSAAGSPNRVYERVLKNVTPGADGMLRLAFSPSTGPAFLDALEIIPSPPDRIHPVRIVAQQNPVTDSDGRLWAGDEYFSGGGTVCRKNMVLNSQDALYQGERYGNFSYRIPVAPGKYRLTLHFAETWFGTPESQVSALDGRIFNVFANGVALLRNYQIVKDAGGPYRGVTKVFDNLEPNAQGLLLIEFVPVENYAEVNAIEVVETE